MSWVNRICIMAFLMVVPQWARASFRVRSLAPWGSLPCSDQLDDKANGISTEPLLQLEQQAAAARHFTTFVNLNVAGFERAVLSPKQPLSMEFVLRTTNGPWLTKLRRFILRHREKMAVIYTALDPRAPSIDSHFQVQLEKLLYHRWAAIIRLLSREPKLFLSYWYDSSFPHEAFVQNHLLAIMERDPEFESWKLALKFFRIAAPHLNRPQFLVSGAIFGQLEDALRAVVVASRNLRQEESILRATTVEIDASFTQMAIPSRLQSSPFESARDTIHRRWGSIVTRIVAP